MVYLMIMVGYSNVLNVRKSGYGKKFDESGYCFVCEDHFQEGEMPDEEDIE